MVQLGISKKVVLGLVLASVSLVACGKRRVIKPGGSNPPAVGQQRQFVGTIVLSPALESQLQNAGLYTPDSCVQYVRWVNGATTVEKAEFTSWEACGSNSLSPDSVAQAGFAVDLKRTGAGQYQLFDAASSTVYGDLQYIDANAQQNLNAGFSPAYTLLNVCQYGPSSSYADSCDLQIESSRYKALERFVFE